MLGRLRTAGRLVRDAWLILGLGILLFCLLEGGARLALLVVRRAEDSSPPGDWRIQADTYADSSWVRAYYEEFDRSYPLRWRPYLYWRRRPYRGAYINVDSAGLRVTPAPTGPAPASARPLRIFTFGGSALWGTGARDAHAIPALVASNLRQDGLSVEVTNFGETGYVSTQSLIALLLELRAGRRPDVVVFYDGVNDTFSAYQQRRPGVPQNEDNRVSDFNLSTADPRRQVRSLVREIARRLATVDLMKRMSRPSGAAGSVSPTTGEDSLTSGVITTYLGNLELLRALGEHYHFEPIAYWQPTVFQKSRLTKYETLERAKAAEMAAFFHETYTRMASSAREGLVHDLSLAFADTPDPMYVDWMHLGETGNAVIARRIADDIRVTKAARAAVARP